MFGQGVGETDGSTAWGRIWLTEEGFFFKFTSKFPVSSETFS